MKLKDNKGTIYASVRQFSILSGIPRTTIVDNLRKKGFYYNKKKGIKVSKYEEEHTEETTDKLLTEIGSKYTREELKLLSKGEGLVDPNTKYPNIVLEGDHHKIGVISDGHLGSKYSPVEFHEIAFKTLEDEGCECILHCGDIVEGLCPRRAKTHIYELSHVGYTEQKNLAIEVFSKCNLPVYCIAGNHDDWYLDMGGDIVEDICSAVPNMHYLGHNQADINIGGVTVRLFHGGDGNSYALSYRLQKLAENFTVGEEPDILLAGHVHKMCYIFERMIHCVSVPSLQKQTPWMAGKKIAAHTGFLIMEFDTYNNKVCNFQLKYFPFYV